MPAKSREPSNWLELRRDEESGIESLRAHFQGHAYDAHSHDELLVGVTLDGVQRFRCRRTTHTSTIGRVILIEPGAVHDGHAPDADGFTYAMLYIPSSSLERGEAATDVFALPGAGRLFRDTLTDDTDLRQAILRAFAAIHGGEGRLARDLSMAALLRALGGRHDASVAVRPRAANDASIQNARDYLHANVATDISLADLAISAGIDRFRLNRLFVDAFGQSPHAYLVNLRLKEARRRLARREHPADVALAVGFSDQSHLGRWFRRAYGLSPGAYQRACTDVLSDGPGRHR